MAANQVDFKILPSDQFSVYSPQTRSDKVITYFTLLSKLRGDILSVGQDDDPNDIVSAFYSSVGGTQTLHLVKADGSEITASVPEPTVGTVTSVDLTASTGISVSGGPITTSGSITVTNTAPDQVVVLTGAGTTSISGTYPSFTITSNDQFVGTVTSVGTSGPITGGPITTTGTIGITESGVATDGYLSAANFVIFNNKQGAITLTTTGSSGAATFISNTLNIPDYGSSLTGYVPYTGANQTVNLNTQQLQAGHTTLTTNGSTETLTVNHTSGSGIAINITKGGNNEGLRVDKTSGSGNAATIIGTLEATKIVKTGGTTSQFLKANGDVDSSVYYLASNPSGFTTNLGTVTSVDLTAGTGITVSGGPITTSGSITVNNNDRGSSQNIFKNFAVSGQSTIVADTNDDTLTVVAGSGVTITTDAITDTLTISATGSGGTVTSVSTTAPITGGTITTTGTIGITQSGAAADGYLSSTDWNTFNSKEPALTKGNLTEATSSVLTIAGGTGAVIGSGTTIQVSQATTTTSGFLSSTDWNTFNGKQGTITLTTTGTTGAATFISNTLNIPNYADQFVGTVTSVAALTLGTTGTDLSSTVANGTTTPVITLQVPTASATNRGALSSTDWTTFNSKEPALTKGNLTEATSAILTITGGTGAVIGTGTSIQVAQSGVSTSGFLSSTDWTTFNSKQSALTFSVPLVNTSGTVSIPAATSLVDGYLSATDFATFNGKQNAITLTTTGTTGAATLIGATLNIPNYADQFVGTVTSVDMSVPTGFAISGNPITTSGTLAVAFASGYSLPTNASQTTWDTAYNDSITAFAYNTSTGALTLTQQDAGTLTATVTLQPFSTTNLVEGTNLYYTDTRARLALSAGTGISYDSATGVITNSAPDQTVVLTGAGTTTISGTYPSFTITSNDQFVGTVTSVDLIAATGISVSGGPITTSGSITVTNTAPDQTVVLTAGTGISTSGTYPSFTVTNSAPDQTVVLTASTGITTSGTYPNFTIANSAPDQTVVLTGGTGITTSGTYPSFTITNSAPDQTVVLTAGTGISVSGTYPSFTVTNSSPSSGGTVTSVAALTLGTTGTDLSSTVVNGTTTPVITLQVPTASAANRGALSSTDWTTFNGKQSAITLTTTGSTGAATFISNTLNIPNYTDQFVGTVTSVDLTAGTGITVSGGPITTSGSITVNNSDRGSSQNIFKNINVITSQDWDDSDFVWNVDDGSWSGGIDQEAIVADNNNDTLFIESVGGISITTDSTTDTIYFDNIDKGSEQNIFKNFAVSGQSTIVADLNDDTLTVASGTGISLTTNASTDTLTITNSAPDQTVVLTAGTGITTSGAYPSFTVTNSVPDQTVVLTAGTGITTSGTYPSFTVTNDDRGSSQNIFKNIAVAGQSDIVADANNDTLTVAAGTGISITTNATTDTLTITNTAASLNPKTESINIRATVPYTVVTPFDDVVIDTIDVKRNAPNTVTSTSKLLAIVTLQVDNTGSIGFTGFTLRLFNQTTSAAVTNTTTKWSAYMYPAASEFGFTSFTYHIPIDDTSVSVSDPIQLQLQLEVGTCDISIANFTLMSISK
jgi:hypothetical protein